MTQITQTELEELRRKAAIADRLQAIAERQNATGLYAALQTPDHILKKMECSVAEQEETLAKSREIAARQESEKVAELAALDNFKVGDTVTFEEYGITKEGQVVEIKREGFLAPNLGIWTGSIGQRATGKPSPIKPLKQKVQVKA